MAEGGLAEIAKQALMLMNGAAGIFNLLAIIALGYCVVKIFFSNIKRGGILLTQIAVGSLYMFSIPKGYTDGFIQWCKQVIACKRWELISKQFKALLDMLILI